MLSRRKTLANPPKTNRRVRVYVSLTELAKSPQSIPTHLRNNTRYTLQSSFFWRVAASQLGLIYIFFCFMRGRSVKGSNHDLLALVALVVKVSAHFRPPTRIGLRGGPPGTAPRAGAAGGQKCDIYVKILRDQRFKSTFCRIVLTVLQSQNTSHTWFESQ